ncbi:MAG: Peptidyl-prolyl isomerase cwc27 [Bogoriella megaspora]|nr:MAG: Peptidyl-prolyl isomerase cwc27 [Bogoriella megaspora]
MSTLYNLEPQPTAKVLLNTTSGDILLELFAKQTPLASRNFLQLCIDGYYDGTVFHRLVPGFIVQGGDPTGTGAGGESSYDGEPFADEFHSRLKFNRRGLLGMANTGKKDDNGSQFFLTLDKTQELQGKNTMFGRIVGDTIYNLMKIGEAEVATEGGDRPLYPTTVTGTEVLVNPFEGMTKRTRAAEWTKDDRTEKRKLKKKAAKNMLSFGGDEGDGEDAAPAAKRPKFNPKLASEGKEDGTKPNKATTSAAPAGQKAVSKQSKRKSSPSPPPQPSIEPAKSSLSRSKAITQPIPRSSQSPSPSTSPEPAQVSSMADTLSKTNAQIEQLKASMKRSTGISTTEKEKPKTALEAMVPSTATRGRKRRQGNGNANTREETRALAAFDAFRKKLDTTSGLPAITSRTSAMKDNVEGSKDSDEQISANGDDAARPREPKDSENDEEAVLCDLHFIANCQSCMKWEDDGNAHDEDDAFAKGGTGWMNHSLSFAKDRLGKNLEWKRKNEEELLVVDPREKEKEIEKGNKKKRKDRRKGA